MKFRPLAFWGLWLLLPSFLRAQVVIEALAPSSALEKAGVREGDLFRSWTRPANPPVHPEPASGKLESPFDWKWLEIEQAPRGPVELRGERQGEPFVVQVPIGLWEAQVRLVLPAELEDLSRRGRELLDKEQVEEGVSCWQQAAELAGDSGNWRLRTWFQLRIAFAWDGGSEQAATAFATALRESRDPHSRIAVLEGMGGTFADLELLEKAEGSFRSAFELKKATWGESLQLAGSMARLGRISYLRSQRAAAPEQRDQLLGAAQEQFVGALAILERWASGGVASAGILDELGLIAFQKGDLDKASLYFDRSISISALLQPVSQTMASALTHRGFMSLMELDFAKAQALCQQALSVIERTSKPGPNMEGILSTLGTVTLMRGDLVGAEDYFRRALVLQSKRMPESLSTAPVFDNLGLVALERVDLDSAQEYFERSLQIRVRMAPGTRHVALSLSLLGKVARERGDLESAERYFRESLAICLEAKVQDTLVDTNLTGLAEIARERGDLAAVERYYRRSLEHKQLTASKVILLSLGETALQLGQLEKAESYLQEYLGGDDESPSTDWSHTFAFQGLANALRRMGRSQQAARYAGLSIESLEAKVDKLGGSQEGKGKFRGRNGDVYRDALRLQLELNRPREAFHLLERFRAQSFLALLAERDLSFVLDLPSELDQERRRLNVSYDRNQLELAALDPEKDKEAVAALQQQQVQLRLRREEIASEMRRQAPRLAALQHPQALTFEQVRATLDPGTVMLSYSVGKEQTHLFIVTGGRELQVETLEIGRKALEKDVERFRQLLEQTRAGAGLGTKGLDWFGRRLYRLLVEPAEKWLAPGKRVVFVPDGPLHLLPFGALIRKDGSYLVEWKPLSTVLSGTVFAELKKQRREVVAEAEPPAAQWVAFGDPWFPPQLAQGRPEDFGEPRLRSASTRAQLQWKRLPQSRREVEGIAQMFPAEQRRTYLDRDASEERAKAVGKDARILHFATHGYVDDRSPFDSGLVLSIPEELTPGRDNGLLQVWEIFESVRLDADLVVLSACETGSGEIRGGEGIIGLTRAFQYAGARSVLASLWKVEDAATADLMQAFYRHLRAGQAKDEALRAAQIEMIRNPLRKAAAPYFWAALQLVGDSR